MMTLVEQMCCYDSGAPVRDGWDVKLILIVRLFQVKLPVIAENCPACFEAPKVSKF